MDLYKYPLARRAFPTWTKQYTYHQHASLLFHLPRVFTTTFRKVFTRLARVFGRMNGHNSPIGSFGINQRGLSVSHHTRFQVNHGGGPWQANGVIVFFLVSRFFLILFCFKWGWSKARWMAVFKAGK